MSRYSKTAILLLLSTCLIAGCVPDAKDYGVVGREAIPDAKLSLDVRLEAEVSEARLREIASELGSGQRSRYERIFISYYLPGMQPGDGAWATSHFTPDLEVRILGASDEQAAEASKAGSAAKRQVVGVWLDPSPLVGGRITIYWESGRTYMRNEFRDGGDSTNEVSSTETRHGTRFEQLGRNRTGDFFLLDERGDLQIRDSQGLIATANTSSLWSS